MMWAEARSQSQLIWAEILLIPVRYSYVNLTLVKWARRKYKRLRDSQTRAAAFIASRHGRMPQLFAHWHLTTYSARV